MVDISVLNPPIQSLAWKNNPEFQVKVRCNHETRTSTRVAIKKNDDEIRVAWSESFSFACNITDDSVVTFTVVGAHILNSKTIGSCKEKVVDLLEMQRDFGSCKLDIAGRCQLIFNVEELSESRLLREVIDGASANLSTFEDPRKAPSSSGQIQEETWSSFLFQFQAFMEVMEKVAGINPYAKLAWSILSIIPKAVLARKDCNDHVKQLCNKLKDIYDHIMDTECLQNLTKTQTAALSALVKQTIECAYFIREYCTKTTIKNTFKAMTGCTSEKIKNLSEQLDYFMDKMINSMLLQTNIVTLRVSDQVSDLTDLMLLRELPYDSCAGFTPGKRCFPGTRQTLINEILQWANDDSDLLSHILVISGQAGTGKSAIAHTIAGLFREQNRLGSIFCFNRSYKERRNVVFSTIARDLADGDSKFRKALVKAIGRAAVRTSRDAETQFHELIARPLNENDEVENEALTIGPVIIVIDALDESGDRTERQDFLNLLFSGCSELPGNYRIMITSRPEQDIESLCNSSAVLCKRMGDVDADETRCDIHTYISNRLSPISQVLDTIDENWCDILTKHARNLFQWAQTACQYMNPDVVQHPPLVKKQWETCISSSSSLYGIYREIISSQLESTDADFIEDFKAIVGAVITAREPLSINVLQNIFQDIQGVKTILRPFGSLFVGVHDSFTPVRPLHISLFDFFDHQGTADKRNEYYINTSHRSYITLACLKLMNQTLRFNICRLETSHLRNRDVPDLDACVEDEIPPHLSYSCRFWAFHLQQSHRGEQLVREIRYFMDHSLLYWFEVLSLLDIVDQGCVAMRNLIGWCTDEDKDLAADAMDVWDFGYDFEGMMTESTPHIYLSALPFTPQDSFISQRYLSAYPGLFTCDIGRPATVRSSRKTGVMRRHPHGNPTSVAFSPKGKYIATGTSFGEFWLWDYVTGELVYQYRPDLSSPTIVDIIFSLDGEFTYCCFRNGDILVWHSRTNEAHMQSYGGGILIGEGDDCYFCTTSSDGRFIALGTRRKGLIYDRETCINLKLFDGHWPFNPRVFSPSGDFLVFEKDYQICVWNTRKRSLHVLSECAHHTSLTLTDSYVAFEGNSRTIEIWDVQTSTKLTEIEHEPRVGHIRFSPDNRYIISSDKMMYSIWNVSTGKLISQSSLDDDIGCLAFSYDSRLIALGTKDGTVSVRQWDTSIQPRPISHPVDDGEMKKIWLQGTYLVLHYDGFSDPHYHLRIFDITTTNTIVLEAEAIGRNLVTVLSSEEHVYVAYVTSRGLCVWDDAKGEVIVDESGCQITKLESSGEYLISSSRGEEYTVKIWNVHTRDLIGGPHKAQRLSALCVSATGLSFIITYDNQIDVRECRSGGIIGGPFTSEQHHPYKVAFSANEKHIISVSTEGVEILDVSTGKRVKWFPDTGYNWTLSPNRKYCGWVTEKSEAALLDTDTGTLLDSPPLNRHLTELVFSSDSKQFMMLSYGNNSSITVYLDVWDIQSEKLITRSISISQVKASEIDHIALSDKHLVLFRRHSRTAIWDLDAYEKMSSLYNTHPNDSQLAECSEAEWSVNDISKSTSKKEMLDYALTAWRKASFSAFAKMDDNGWVSDLHGELLFWVPKNRRWGLWYPCVMHVPLRSVTKLNFNNFVHGPRWTECRGNTSA